MEFLFVSPIAVGVAVFFVVLAVGGVIMMIRRSKSAPSMPPPPTVRVVMPNQYAASDSTAVGSEPMSASASAPAPEEYAEAPVPSARPNLAKLGFVAVLLMTAIAIPTGVYLVNRPEKQGTQPKAVTGFNQTGIVCQDGQVMLQIAVTENQQCEYISAPQTRNPVNPYTTTYTITNNSRDAQAHTITYRARSYFCPQAYGEPVPGDPGEVYCASNGQGLEDRVSDPIPAGGSIQITIERPFEQNAGAVCGSIQEDFDIVSVDGDTSCNGGPNGGLAGFGYCQTGRDCVPSTPTPTPTGPQELTLTPTVTLTPTPNPNQCLNVKLYDADWTLVTPAEMTQFTAGDTIHIAVVGANELFVTKGRIRVKAGDTFSDWTETTDTKPGDTNVTTQEFYIDYTFPPAIESFAVEAEIFDNGEWR